MVINLEARIGQLCYLQALIEGKCDVCIRCCPNYFSYISALFIACRRQRRNKRQSRIDLSADFSIEQNYLWRIKGRHVNGNRDRYGLRFGIISIRRNSTNAPSPLGQRQFCGSVNRHGGYRLIAVFSGNNRTGGYRCDYISSVATNSNWVS